MSAFDKKRFDAKKQQRQAHLTDQEKSEDDSREFKHFSDATGNDVSQHYLDVAKGLKLSEAEVRAIRIYGAKNFEYINPAMADIEGWEIEATDDQVRSEKKEEGRTHADMAMKGLLKMDEYKGDTFRGLACTPIEFKRDWSGSTWKLGALGSSSKAKERAVHFMGEGRAKNPKEKTIGIFVVVHNGGGRDIEEIAPVKSEREVLLLPGTFDITSMDELPVADGMDVYGEPMKNPTAFEKIYLVHVKGKGAPKEKDAGPKP